MKFDNTKSNRSFGIVFSIVFFIVALYLVTNSREYVLAFALSVVFLLLAFFAPTLLSWPNKIWTSFGKFLGLIVAPIFVGLVYLLTVLPIGLIMRLFGKDIIKQKIDKNAKSYWVKRKEPIGPMKNQF